MSIPPPPHTYKYALSFQFQRKFANIHRYFSTPAISPCPLRTASSAEQLEHSTPSIPRTPPPYIFHASSRTNSAFSRTNARAGTRWHTLSPSPSGSCLRPHTPPNSRPRPCVTPARATPHRNRDNIAPVDVIRLNRKQMPLALAPDARAHRKGVVRRRLC